MRSKHVLWLLGLGMFLCSACEPLGGEWYIDIKNDSSEEILVATGCKKVPVTRRFILTNSITRTKKKLYTDLSPYGVRRQCAVGDIYYQSGSV